MKHKKIGLVLLLASLSSVGFANSGYIHHKIVNTTPYELYVGVRQQFQYPIDGCLGPIASGATKECDGQFEKVDAKFIIELVNKNNEELRGSIPIKTSQAQNMFFTWTLTLDKQKELDASVTVENKAVKWSSKTLIKR